VLGAREEALAGAAEAAVKDVLAVEAARFGMVEGGGAGVA